MRSLSALPDTLRSYSFTYDDSGNRILREAEIVQLKSGVTGFSDKEDYQDQVIEKEIAGSTVKIYPNPTNGLLTISISGTVNNASRVIVYNTIGQVIADRQIDATEGKIDLSKQSSGIYFMRITIDGKSSEWKVLKE